MVRSLPSTRQRGGGDGTIVGVGHLGVGKGHILDSIIRPATNATNRQAMATGAEPPGKGDIRAGVDRDTVVLVVDLGA